MTDEVVSERMNRRWISAALPVAVACGAVALLLWPVLFGDQTLFYRDLYLQYIGTGRLLHSGQLPGGLIWDPFLSGGQPLLGNPNQFILYPSRVLYLVADPVTALNSEIALHLYLGAAGAVLLARRLGTSPVGSLVAGIAYSLSGLSVSIVSHLGRLMAYHWMPWILLAIHAGFCDRGEHSRRWRLAVPVLFAVQWLTGTAESVAMTAVLAIGWLGVVRSDGGRGRKLLHGGGLVVLGLGLAAIQILPAAEMVNRSDRAAYAEAGASVDWSLHPLRVPEMVVPGYCGPIDEAYAGRSYWGTGLFDRGFPLVVSLYLGISVVFLACVGWFRSAGDQTWRGLRLLFVVIAGGAVVVACGQYLPLVGEAWRTIPGFNVLRYPVKALLAVGLPVALLAGRGLDAWSSAERRTARRIGWIALIAATGSVALATLISLDGASSVLGWFFPDRGDLAADGLPIRLVHVALVLAALALVGLLSGRVRKGMLLVLAAAIVAADLVAAAPGFLPLAPRRLLEETPAAVTEVRNRLTSGRLYRDLDGDGISNRIVEDRAWESAGWLIQDLTYSVAATYQVPMVFNYDIAGLAERRMAHLERAVADSQWNGRLKLFQAAAVELVLTREQLQFSGLDLEHVARDAQGRPLFLYRVEAGAVGVRWVGRERRAESAEDALSAVVAPDFDPLTEVVTESDAPLTTPPGRVLESLSRGVEISSDVISAPRPGWVVTAVPWHPDLVVRAGGTVVAAERVNYGFAGFEVPAGRHRIELIFLSRSVALGGLVTVVSVLIWGALALLSWRPRPQGSSDSPMARSPRSA